MPAPTDDTFTTKLQPAIKSLRGAAMRWLRDANDVDDVMQATYLRAWKYADRFDAERCARAWCYTILRNETARFISARGRADASFDPEVIDAMAITEFEPESTIDRTRIETARASKLRLSMRKMPTQFRDALEDELDGLDCRESASRRGTNVNTIHGRRHRGRDRIRQTVAA